MTPMPLDTTAEPPVENKIDLGLGGHKARDQPEGEEDGAGLDAHAPLGLAVLLLERPQDGDFLQRQTSEIITKTSLRFWTGVRNFHHHNHKIMVAQFVQE